MTVREGAVDFTVRRTNLTLDAPFAKNKMHSSPYWTPSKKKKKKTKKKERKKKKPSHIQDLNVAK